MAQPGRVGGAPAAFLAGSAASYGAEEYPEESPSEEEASESEDPPELPSKLSFSDEGAAARTSARRGAGCADGWHLRQELGVVAELAVASKMAKMVRVMRQKLGGISVYFAWAFVYMSDHISNYAYAWVKQRSNSLAALRRCCR